MRGGLQVTSDAVALRYQKTSEVPRFAFVVPTKVDKRATQRNRMRRILSESVRLLLPDIAGTDGVFIIRKNIAKLSQQDIKNIATDLLHSAKLL